MVSLFLEKGLKIILKSEKLFKQKCPKNSKITKMGKNRYSAHKNAFLNCFYLKYICNLEW